MDELTGLLGAVVLVLPSKGIHDLQFKRLKEKFKDRKFAAGCSRDVLIRGAETLGWELERLQQDAILAMQDCDASVKQEMKAWGAQ